MKNEQRQQARDLFIQSGFTKTAIAEQLGVSRRTVYQWSVEGDWDKLRLSARNMPSMLAQKVYYLIGHFTDHLLSRESCYQSVSKDEVNILHKLAVTVNKLKQGSTVSENMETFTHLLDRMQRTDPELAQQVSPHISGYVSARQSRAESDMFLHGFDQDGRLPFPEEEIMEKWKDEEDFEALQQERAAAHQPQPAAPAAAPQPQQPSRPSAVTPQPKQQPQQPAKNILGHYVRNGNDKSAQPTANPSQLRQHPPHAA